MLDIRRIAVYDIVTVAFDAHGLQAALICLCMGLAGELRDNDAADE